MFDLVHSFFIGIKTLNFLNIIFYESSHLLTIFLYFSERAVHTCFQKKIMVGVNTSLLGLSSTHFMYNFQWLHL